MAGPLLNVTLVGDTEVVAKLRTLGPGLVEALSRKVTALRLMLEAYIKTEKLSGQVLNRRTSALFRSITGETIVQAMAVWGRVFSSGDVKYAAIHEFGGTIPAHKIEASKADALHFMIGGKEIFVKSVQIPDVHMPERSFMRSGLSDKREVIETGLKDAVLEELQARLA